MSYKLIIIGGLLLYNSLTSAQSNIGYWATDKLGLPTYIYTGEIPYKITTRDGKEINYPEDPYFLLGNYGITIFVHTSGVYDFYTLRRAWGRLNVPLDSVSASSTKINIDGKEFVLTGINSEIALRAKKEFGTGFANFNMQITNDIQCERLLAILPSKKINTGKGALLVTINLTNTGKKEHQIEFSETVLANYKMVGEYRISYTATAENNSKFISAKFEPHTDESISRQEKDEASTYDFYPPELFIKGNGEIDFIQTKISDEAVNISAIKKFILKPGEKKTISFVIGYKLDNENISEIASELFEIGANEPKFRKLWKQKLPDYSWQKDEIVQREMYWNTYVLEASAKYNIYFEETFIPQGMAYDYLWGLNAVARDHLHYSLPTNYFNPKLSKSIIRFVLKTMMPTGYFNYNINGYGYSAPNLWSPSDLQLHLFWAIAEYLKATGDYEFLNEETVYYPKRTKYSASVLEKLTVAFNYLNDEISVGSHGLTRILNSDWNDQIWHNEPLTIYYNTAESHYNSSMAIVVFKELIDVLKKAGKVSKMSNQKKEIEILLKKLSIYRNNQLNAFTKDLGNRDFVKRAYYDKNLSMGDSTMHIESQLYTLMIEEIPLEQRQRIVKQIKNRLMDNEVLGVRTSEVKVNDVFKTGTHENGGIWQYIQGMYALGLLHVDKNEADEIIQKMSFNNFAKQYPNYWPGQWTGMDCVNSSLANSPGLVSNPGSVYMKFPAYCTHIHSWSLLYQLKKNIL